MRSFLATTDFVRDGAATFDEKCMRVEGGGLRLWWSCMERGRAA